MSVAPMAVSWSITSALLLLMTSDDTAHQPSISSGEMLGDFFPGVIYSTDKRNNKQKSVINGRSGYFIQVLMSTQMRKISQKGVIEKQE